MDRPTIVTGAYDHIRQIGNPQKKTKFMRHGNQRDCARFWVPSMMHEGATGRLAPINNVQARPHSLQVAILETRMTLCLTTRIVLHARDTVQRRAHLKSASIFPHHSIRTGAAA